MNNEQWKIDNAQIKNKIYNDHRQCAMKNVQWTIDNEQ